MMQWWLLLHKQRALWYQLKIERLWSFSWMLQLSSGPKYFQLVSENSLFYLYSWCAPAPVPPNSSFSSSYDISIICLGVGISRFCPDCHKSCTLRERWPNARRLRGGQEGWAMVGTDHLWPVWVGAQWNVYAPENKQSSRIQGKVPQILCSVEARTWRCIKYATSL